MGLTFLTGYVLGQHGRQSARLASLSSAPSSGSRDDVLDLHERVDRLVLAMDAMWSLLEERGFTADDLKARIAQIDATDGVVDGRRTPQPGLCSRCGAKVAVGLPACQFCGTDLPENADDPLASV
jgi:hypothetical protein